jgi:AraC family transcriptional regulator of adaptative response/methylated-DNA-[protein]-cysteine methyltransferase
MLEAFLARNASYEGVFVTAVRTTGVFCRPTCAAKKPAPANVEFYPSAREALLAGYRPCRRCQPMEPPGAAPKWLAPLLEAVEADPTRRWRDADLREMGINPDRVRRWFRRHHGMGFHAYHRARRLGLALGRIRLGDSVTAAAFDTGYESLSAFNDAFRRLLGASPRQTRGSTMISVNRIPTPLGPMLAGATDEALCLLEFTDRRMLETQLQRLRSRLGAVLVPGSNPVLERVAAELERYFSGELQTFSVPLASPGTELQEQVWAELSRLSYGTTASYAEVARAIGRPGAVRAVARAIGDNRIAIVIPCHRVIGSDRRLTGYGGGLWRKRRLLELEGVEVPGEARSRRGPRKQADLFDRGEVAAAVV